jgi:putative glutamine amidotransferase
MLMPNGTYRHALSNTYVEALLAAGAAPLLIPSSAHEPALLAIYHVLDGLLLSGGVDVDPINYGEELNGTEEIDDLRDITEILLTRWAMRDSMPILGICRGQQVLNVALGGSLYQDIPSQIPATNLDHRMSDRLGQRNYIAHSVLLNPDSRMVGLLGATELAANTLHHQSVKQVGTGLKVVGVAPDGVIEALESEDPNRWVFSVQCHPEELWRDHDWATRLMRGFVEAARSTKLATHSR